MYKSTQQAVGDGIPNPGKTSSHIGNVSLLSFLSSSFYVLLVEIVLYSLICSLPRMDGAIYVCVCVCVCVCMCSSIHSPTYVSTISFNHTAFHGSQRSLAWLRLHPWQKYKEAQFFFFFFLKKGAGSAVYISKSQKALTLWASNTAFGVFPKKKQWKKKQAKIYLHKIICCSMIYSCKNTGNKFNIQKLEDSLVNVFEEYFVIN